MRAVQPVGRTQTDARGIDRVVGGVSKTMLVLSIVMLAVITVLLVTNVVLRFWDGNLRGIVELISYGLMACIMLALPYTHRSGSHIRITMIVERFGARTQRWIYIAAQLITAVVTLAIALMYLMNTLTGERHLAAGLLPIPELPFRIAIIAGFAFWGIEALMAMMRPDQAVDVHASADSAGVQP